MTTLTIPQKMSNTGSIYDLASDNYAIVINLGKQYAYAVGGPSYYNLGWTRHKTESAAIRQAAKLQKSGYNGIRVIDVHGREGQINGDEILWADYSNIGVTND